MLPWGPLAWLLPKLGRASLSKRLLACVAHEDRCVAVPKVLHQAGIETSLLLVNDPPSEFTPRINEKTARNSEALRAAGIRAEPSEISLLANDQRIADVLDSIVPAGATEPLDLWIDISCIPKRIFFLWVKLVLQRSYIQNLVITYTLSTGHYADPHLSQNPDEVRPLPGFAPESDTEPDTLIVAVGFESLGLPQFLDEYRDRKKEIVFLLPFSPGQPYSRRTWASAMTIGGGPEVGLIKRLVAVDAFGTYESLSGVRSTEEAKQRPLALAPYGPKPMSLGMCLYAIETHAAVFYTQPRIYHPDYSTGIGQSYAYCLRLGGRDMWGTGPDREVVT